MGLDLASDLIPVAPAAHYFMGGIVRRNRWANVSLAGLHAIGEVALHRCPRCKPAGQQFAAGRAGVWPSAREQAGRVDLVDRPDRQFPQCPSDRDPAPVCLARTRRRNIQQIMSTHVAVVRSANRTLDNSLRQWLDALDRCPRTASRPWRLRNLYLLAREITTSSLHREESRGAHFRLDYPDARFCRSTDRTNCSCNRMRTVQTDAIGGLGSAPDRIRRFPIAVALRKPGKTSRSACRSIRNVRRRLCCDLGPFRLGRGYISNPFAGDDAARLGLAADARLLLEHIGNPGAERTPRPRRRQQGQRVNHGDHRCHFPGVGPSQRPLHFSPPAHHPRALRHRRQDDRHRMPSQRRRLMSCAAEEVEDASIRTAGTLTAWEISTAHRPRMVRRGKAATLR